MEIPGTISLQASYMFTNRLLRGVTFEVLHSRSSALSPTMLSLSETFLKILLWIAFSDVVTFF